MTGIAFSWEGSGFGNALILAHLTKIVNDNGIHARFVPHKKTHNMAVNHKLVDVPVYDPEIHKDYFLHTKQFPAHFHLKSCDLPILQQYMKDVEKIFEQTLIFDREKHNHVPVIFKDPGPHEKVDVVLCTHSSPWSPYRDWPYFAQLKEMFYNEGITYIDLNQHGIMSFLCLSYVKHCKLYVGLETGTSHYVSHFANGKALIIQGGFSPFYYWAWPYDYDFVSADVSCEYRPCFIDKKFMKRGFPCKHNVACMTAIRPEQVFEEVRRRIQ